MNTNYWETFYRDFPESAPSTFAQFVSPHLIGTIVDLGCGNGRDLHYFLKEGYEAYGVDEAFNSDVIENQSVSDFIKYNEAPKNVYTRFFWHAIPRKEQLAILRWVKEYIFIEARTTEDEQLEKHFPQHERNFVNVPQLVKDLKENGFQILHLKEGHFSPYKGENPHLIRIIARK